MSVPLSLETCLIEGIHWIFCVRIFFDAPTMLRPKLQNQKIDLKNL
jgi:hypothetical protein